MTQNRRWRRTQSLQHSWQTVHDEDFTLVDEKGEHIARIFDLGDASLFGSWRWWIQPFYKIDSVGSAQTGAEAKNIVEERLVDALSSQTRHGEHNVC